MFPQKQETTRRSLMRAQKTILQLRVEDQDIRSAYAAWKPCIALLSSEVKFPVPLYLLMLMRALIATTLEKSQRAPCAQAVEG